MSKKGARGHEQNHGPAPCKTAGMAAAENPAFAGGQEGAAGGVDIEAAPKSGAMTAEQAVVLHTAIRSIVCRFAPRAAGRRRR